MAVIFAGVQSPSMIPMHGVHMEESSCGYTFWRISSTLRHDVANHSVFLMDGGKNILAEVNT